MLQKKRLQGGSHLHIEVEEIDDEEKAEQSDERPNDGADDADPEPNAKKREKGPAQYD